MRRLALASLLVLLAATGWSLSRHAPADTAVPDPSCKPSPPIALEARIVGDPSAPFGIVADASSPASADVEVEIVLPAGVTHLAGERRGRGKRVGLRVDARADDRSRREIFVRATVRHGNAVLTRVVPLILNDAPLPSPGVLKRNSRGENILEFKP